MLFADVCLQADLPPGTVNIITGPGEIGMHLATHPDIDKVAFTGSTRSARRSAAAWRAQTRLTLELGGKAANIVFDDAPLDQAVEGIVNGIYFNQGEVCCAGSRLLVGIDRRHAGRQAQGPAVDDPRGRPARQEHRRRRDQLEGPAREDHRARRVRRRRGRRPLPASVRPARARLLLPPDAVHERRPEPPHRPRGDLRAGPLGADVPDARGGRREGEQHAVRPVGRRLDGQGLAHPRDGVADAGGRRVGQHVQQVRPDLAVRRLQGIGFRARRRHARAALTCGWRTADGRRPQRRLGQRDVAQWHVRQRCRPRIGVRKTYKLYIGGAFPRSESGRSYLVSAADGTPLANAVRSSRKDVRDAVRAAAPRSRAGPGRPR